MTQKLSKKIITNIMENRWLILIILFGAFLRIFYLGNESFWLDEAETVFATQKNSSYIIHSFYTNILAPEIFGPRGGGSMPLYYLLANYWTKLFGLSEFKLRLPSAIFGIISIYLVYLIGKKFFGKAVGLIAAFIISINHQHIYYSQEARMYTFIVMLTMISVYSFYQLLTKGKILHLLIYVISTIALLYTHYYSILVPAFEFLYTFLILNDARYNLKKVIICWAMIALSYAFWIPVLLRQFSKGATLSGIQGPLTINKLIELAIGFNSWVSPDLQSRSALAAWKYFNISFFGWITIISILLISVIFIIFFLREITIFLINGIKDKKITSKNKQLLLLWFLIPIAIPLFLAIFSPHSSTLGYIRYVLFISPAYYLLISKSIYGFGKRKNSFSITVILFLIITFSIAPIYSYYKNPDKGQYKEAAAYIASKEKNEPIIVHGAPIFLPFDYYYGKFNKNNEVYKSFDIEMLKNFADSHQRFWVVASMLKYYDPSNSFLAYLNSHFVLIEEKDFIDVKIFMYKN